MVVHPTTKMGQRLELAHKLGKKGELFVADLSPMVAYRLRRLFEKHLRRRVRHYPAVDDENGKVRKGYKFILLMDSLESH